MKAYALALVSLAMGTSAFAGYSETYKAAFDQFKARGQEQARAQTCANLAGQAFTEAADDAQRYDALVLQSRCTYYVGMKAKSDDDKIKIFGLGKNLADKAKGYQPGRAEALFFYGINLGRWAEANGIMKSLGERHNLRKSMEAVQKLKAKDDEGRDIEGKMYDGYGANRTLGRMYFKLPGMFGGDNRLAEKLLAEAVEKSSTKDAAYSQYPNALNVYYYAEVLVANGKKDEAKRVLRELVSFDGNESAYNPNRVPETQDEIQLAKKLLKDIEG